MADLLKNIEYDSTGNPILSAEQIENIVEEILKKFNPELLREMQCIPIAELMEALKEINFMISPLDYECLGRINLKTSLIELNSYHFSPEEKSLRWRFTLAHEIGHFFLHSLTGKIMLEDTEQMFRIFDQPPQKEIRDWQEWQANIFASALLLPRKPFCLFVERELRKHDFKKNQNVFFVDNQPESQRNYNIIIDTIHLKSNVSKAVAKIRLEKLGYVKYADNFRPCSARHISEIFFTQKRR